MIPVHFDRTLTDDDRRAAVYRGELFVTSPTTATLAFCDFAKTLIKDAFGDLDAEIAQDHLAVEEFAAILSQLKPLFIHHRRSRELLQSVLLERGCDLDLTYFDVPRLRSSTSGGYLTSGIAYAWHPHRDTWYSAPMGQMNFWMPVYDVEPDNGMAFHIDHFGSPVPNTSSSYNYYEWNQIYRRAAASNVMAETRPLPGPIGEVDVRNSLTLVSQVGGLIEFSGQHLHSSVPNNTGKTRYSIDFRTVHIGDILEMRSARNVDAACTGSSIRDFVRASDFSPMPDEVVEMFNDGSESRGELLYADNARDRSEATSRSGR